MLFENLYYRPTDLIDLQEQLFKQGDYEASDFLNSEIAGYEADMECYERSAKEWEVRADELDYGMRQILNLVNDTIEYVNGTSRLNRKEIMERLKGIANDFEEYI